jgi:hypothetical protein
MRWLFLSLWLGVVPTMVAAQVTMEAHLGLQGTVRLEKWNLITVRLHNIGTPTQGTLGVRVWRGSELRGDLHVTNFTRLVELSHRAHKRLTFVVPITSITHPIEVFFRTDDTVVLQQRLDLHDALTAEQVILGVTHDLSLDFLATLFPTSTRVVYLSPQDLPPVWQGYDSVSAVVVKGFSLQTLSEAQSVALQQWIARGGTLIVAGDSQYALLTEPRLQALLPVQVLGVQQLDGLPAFAARYGTPVPAVPLVVVRARLANGQLMVGDQEAPLLAQRLFGKGRVVFLAMDYAAQPLLGWTGNAALWTEMLQLTDNVDVSRVFAELGLLDETHPVLKLLGRPLLAYPSHLALSLFLLLYGTGLGGLFWWFRKRLVRPLFLWSTFLLLIGGCTAWAYRGLAERGLRQPALLFDLATAEVFPDTGYTHLRGALGVFSASGGHFVLPLQSQETILRHTFTRGVGRAGQELEVTTSGAPAIRHIVLEPWVLRLFTVESMAPAPLQCSVQRHTAGLTVQIENRAPWPLQGIIVAYKGMLFPLGTLAPGDAILHDLTPGRHTTEGTADRAWQALFRQHPAVSDSRLKYIYEVLLQQHFGDQRLVDVSDTPLLTAWIPRPATLQDVPGALPMWGMTLVVSRFPSSF